MFWYQLLAFLIILEEEYEHMLKFLEQLEVCYELSEKEALHYGQKGFLFTSLRPRADLLQIPFDKNDHSEVIISAT